MTRQLAHARGLRNRFRKCSAVSASSEPQSSADTDALYIKTTDSRFEDDRDNRINFLFVFAARCDA